MKYQFLRHDGFIYRRPPSEPDDIDSVLAAEMATEIWDGTQWRHISVGLASEPAAYGHQLSEDAARNFLGDEWQP